MNMIRYVWKMLIAMKEMLMKLPSLLDLQVPEGKEVFK